MVYSLETLHLFVFCFLYKLYYITEKFYHLKNHQTEKSKQEF